MTCSPYCYFFCPSRDRGLPVLQRTPHIRSSTCPPTTSLFICFLCSYSLIPFTTGFSRNFILLNYLIYTPIDFDPPVVTGEITPVKSDCKLTVLRRSVHSSYFPVLRSLPPLSVAFLGIRTHLGLSDSL